MLRTPREPTAAELTTSTADAAAGRPVDWSDDAASEKEEKRESEEEAAAQRWETVDDTGL